MTEQRRHAAAAASLPTPSLADYKVFSKLWCLGRFFGADESIGVPERRSYLEKQLRCEPLMRAKILPGHPLVFVSSNTTLEGLLTLTDGIDDYMDSVEHNAELYNERKIRRRTRDALRARVAAFRAKYSGRAIKPV